MLYFGLDKGAKYSQSFILKSTPINGLNSFEPALKGTLQSYFLKQSQYFEFTFTIFNFLYILTPYFYKNKRLESAL